MNTVTIGAIRLGAGTARVVEVLRGQRGSQVPRCSYCSIMRMETQQSYAHVPLRKPGDAAFDAGLPLLSAAVLAFTEVMADRDMHGKYSLELYDMGRYMRLDAAAQRALNVLKSKTDANDNFSLYGLLNRARTAMGKRLLKARSCGSDPATVPLVLGGIWFASLAIQYSWAGPVPVS